MRVAVLLPVALLTGTPTLAAELTLTRAILSSSGVGQFDYAADVDGPGELSMDVALRDVDDVLKSLRVADPAGPTSARLQGRDPLAETFRALAFSQAAFDSPGALLAALTGAQVKLTALGATGRILGVSTEDTMLPNNGGIIQRHRLTIATETGIETVLLEDTPGIEFLSPTTRSQIASALAAIAAHGAQDRRQVQIALRCLWYAVSRRGE